MSCNRPIRHFGPSSRITSQAPTSAPGQPRGQPDQPRQPRPQRPLRGSARALPDGQKSRSAPIQTRPTPMGTTGTMASRCCGQVPTPGAGYLTTFESLSVYTDTNAASDIPGTGCGTSWDAERGAQEAARMAGDRVAQAEGMPFITGCRAGRPGVEHGFLDGAG